MNFSYSLARTRFLNGAAKVRIIFKSASFSGKIFKKVFEADLHAPVLVRTQGLISHPFFKWECKGTAFFFTSKSFSAPKRTESCNDTRNMLNITTIQDCYNFVKVSKGHYTLCKRPKYWNIIQLTEVELYLFFIIFACYHIYI